ncbi:hypothetical protein [Nocardia salmonicida]|uniref:hypothetical protein n=1 Tax=Nocardia salmonicida TaxID=53431 RepID=UPI003CF788F5
MPPPPRSRRLPTQDRAEATRNQIFDAAADLFGERGITETSTDRCASALDVDGRERRELIAATAEMVAICFGEHRVPDRDLTW